MLANALRQHSRYNQPFDFGRLTSGALILLLGFLPRAVHAVELAPGTPGVRLCIEPPHVRVGVLSPNPVYNNKIFTRGFTFLLESAGDSASFFPGQQDYAKTSDDLERAFQSAILLWVVALSDIKRELDPPLVAFIDALTSRSARRQLLVPPPVIRVSCRENAMFVVRLYKAAGDTFPDPSKEALAKAQIEGRTILINARSTQSGRNRQLVWDLRMPKVKDKDRVNLIATMAHELGHAFGLRHRSDQVKSIMNPPFLLLPRPGKEDGRALASVLRANIDGGRPGELDLTRCDGLMVAEADSLTSP